MAIISTLYFFISSSFILVWCANNCTSEPNRTLAISDCFNELMTKNYMLVYTNLYAAPTSNL